MNAPTGDGWASPGQDPDREPAPGPDATGPAAPGWGGPASGAPAYGPPGDDAARYGAPTYGAPAPGGPGPQTPQWGAGDWGSAVPQAPRPGVVPLRPLGLGELLDGAVGLVRGYPRPSLGISALVAVVTTAVQLVLLLTVLRPLLDVDTLALEAGDPDELAGLLAGFGTLGLATFALGIVSGAILTGFMTGIAGKAVLGAPLQTSELWASTRRALPRLIGAALLIPLIAFGPVLLAALLTGLLVAALGTTVGGLIGALILLAAAVFLPLAFVRLALTTSVIVLEDASVRTALRRSWRLVAGSFWRVLGILVLTAVVGGFVAQVLQLPFVLLSGGGGPLEVLSGSAGLTTRSLVLSTLGSGVASTVVAPFAAGVSALLYIDRRMRKEGLDVALQAAAAARA